MAATWTYSDWETTTTAGSAAQLARLKLHIQEVSDAFNGVNMKYPGGRAHDHTDLSRYLELLLAEKKALEAKVALAVKTRVGFTRARAIYE